MKRLSKILWGILIVALGVAVALDVVGLVSINWGGLLRGWWTLFIIVPCLISIISNGPRTASCIGLCVGVLLMLGNRRIIDFKTAAKLILPAIIIIIGISVIVKALTRDKQNAGFDKRTKDIPKGGEDYTATFAGQNVRLCGEVLSSFTVNAIFGGVKCDLTGATLEHDIVIEASAIFGGIDLIVPANMPVKLNTTNIFGGSEDKRSTHAAARDDVPTVYIKGCCVFGGLDVK